MSRVLKRPMFRKGGEVMEGVMTGIKPRKMFFDGTNVLDDVREKVSLIEKASGPTSPLGDPLTQFLLTTGQNLISGQSAGGTKLQEIVGATKKPLATAIKAQQLKDLQRKKLITSLISKTKPNQTKKLFEALKNTINPDTKQPYTYQEVAALEAKKELFKKGTLDEEKKYMEGKKIFENLSSVKTFTGKKKYEPLEIKLIQSANEQIDNNPQLFASMDESNPYVQRGDYKPVKPVPTGKKDEDGKEITLDVVVPNDPDDFTGNRVYYVIGERKFFYFDSAKDRLVEYKIGG
jgi:hypothetical protein